MRGAWKVCLEHGKTSRVSWSASDAYMPICTGSQGGKTGNLGGHVCVHVHMNNMPSEARTELSASLELELHVAVSFLMWMLETEYWSCA